MEGNYNGERPCCFHLHIIPLREMEGNYNLDWQVLRKPHYTLERDGRELQHLP